jgi:hypothetical protein
MCISTIVWHCCQKISFNLHKKNSWYSLKKIFTTFRILYSFSNKHWVNRRVVTALNSRTFNCAYSTSLECIILTGGRLTEIHLIKIVFYQLIETLIISWPNFLTLFTWSKVLIMISVKRLNFRRLTKLFDQLPKSVSSFLSVDRNFFKA